MTLVKFKPISAAADFLAVQRASLLTDAAQSARGDSYDAQLKATLFVINGQAEAAAKREAPNTDSTHG